jgi:inosine-uridine nucleoside N-ribohydrolase
MGTSPAPVIIDTDPGVDDFIAILMALRSPDLDLLGLTTVGGNTSLENATLNALRTLQAEDRSDIPVASGAGEGRTRPFTHAGHFHGETGLAMELPVPDTKPIDTPAVTWLSRTLIESSDSITLLPVGPVTNIARLIEEHPQATDRIGRMIVMGGAVDCPGNATDYAEFNTWNDPEAAKIVFGASIETTLIGLDVCNQVAFTRENIRDGAGPGRLMMDTWFAGHPDLEEFHLCDPLAVAVAIDPTLVRTESISVAVDTSDGPERGNTSRGAGGPPIGVALEVDAERAVRLISALAL